MKLIIAIIQDDCIDGIVKVLMENKIRTTKLSSTGGFLKSGNTTLLIGVEDEELDTIVELIRGKAGCKNVRVGSEEVNIGGANLFVMDMDEHLKF